MLAGVVMPGKNSRHFFKEQQYVDDARKRVANTLDRFVELAAEHAVVMEVGPDGKYHPVDQPPKSTDQRHAK